MHTISIPCRIEDEASHLVLLRKRRVYALLVRMAYAHLAKSQPAKDDKQTDKDIFKSLTERFTLSYGVESHTFSSAMLEAKGILEQDKELCDRLNARREAIIARNADKAQRRKALRREIADLKSRLKAGALADKAVATAESAITARLKTIASLSPRPEPKRRKLGHLVFGGKRNLLAHQNRIEAAKAEMVRLGEDVTLGAAIRRERIAEQETRIAASKQAWKASRLRPLSICGETRKRGNRFFKLSSDLTTCDLTFTRKISGGKSGPSISETARVSLSPLRGAWAKRLSLLQRAAEAGRIALFFRLCDERLCVTYDPQDLKALERDDAFTAQSLPPAERRAWEASNPLTRPALPRRRFCPDSRRMTQVRQDVAIGIDQNPSGFGVSICQYVPVEKNIQSLENVRLLDYRFFALNLPVDNATGKYSPKQMREALSGIVAEILTLARRHHAGSIVLEDGLGNLRGRTRASKLNGTLNHWARGVFADILARRAALTTCDRLSYRKGSRWVKLFRPGIAADGAPRADLDENERQTIRVQRDAPCFTIRHVWPAYSSIIGNLIDWKAIAADHADHHTTRTEQSPGIGVPTTPIPDACGAAVEICRRGLTQALFGKVSLPPYAPIRIDHTKKTVMIRCGFAPETGVESKTKRSGADGPSEQAYGWTWLSAVLKKIPKGSWATGTLGYRNPHPLTGETVDRRVVREILLRGRVSPALDGHGVGRSASKGRFVMVRPIDPQGEAGDVWPPGHGPSTTFCR